MFKEKGRFRFVKKKNMQEACVVKIEQRPLSRHKRT